MENQANIQNFLELLSQPGFFVRENRITYANQAAQALLLMPGLEIDPLMNTGCTEYHQFLSGQLHLSLNIGSIIRNATVIRMEEMDLFLLEPESDSEEFRSMELISMELRNPLMTVMNSAQQLLSQLEPENREAALRMNRSLAQLLRLTSNLSDAGRYRESSHMETRDICALLEELLEKYF